MTDIRYLHLLRQDCPLPPGTHVVLYTRDSGGEDQDRSVSQQREAAEEYCQHFGLVLEEVYCDEAEKATAIEKRDEFARLMRDMRQRFAVIYDPAKREQRTRNKPFGVLCWKSNRLGRDLIHTRNVKSDLRLRGITIISLIPIVETGNAGLDSLIESFYEYQDQEQLNEISDNAKRGLAQLVTMRDTHPDFLTFNPQWQPTGAYLSIMPGGVPVGFKGERIRVGTYKRKRGTQLGEPRIVQRIVPDPELWDRCRLAWEMRRAGATIREIMQATRLYKDVSSYASFFGNIIYTGTLEYGGQRIPDFVPALIPMEWWEDEQRRKAARARKLRGDVVESQYEPRRVGANHLLSGMLFCTHEAGEEHPMLADVIPAKKGQRGHWDFYICARKKNSRGEKCGSKRIGASVIENSVIDALLNDVLTLDNLRPVAEAIAAQVNATSQDASVQLNAVTEELERVERQIDNLLSAIEDIGLSSSLKQKLMTREGERERLRTQAAALQKLVIRAKDVPRVTDEKLSAWIAHLSKALRGEDRAQARLALRHFVSRVTFEGMEGTIHYTFPTGEVEGASVGLGKREVDQRDGYSKVSIHWITFFPCPPVLATAQAKRHPDKQELAIQILAMLDDGLRYADIARMLQLDPARIRQIAIAHGRPSATRARPTAKC